jgi:hypothetical protein
MLKAGETDSSYRRYVPLFLTIFGSRWGFEYSRVGLGNTPYLDRYIIYAFGGTLRLHKFWRGDDDRAPHDHPWWFITIPFASYRETVHIPYQRGVYDPLTGTTEWSPGADIVQQRVQAFLPHFRSAKHRHIVRGRANYSTKPFWTIVITGGPSNRWGFWPAVDRFIPWRQWAAYVKENML